MSIIARYNGEWLVLNQAFSIKTDSKTYSWIISREIPAMSYSTGDDEDDAVTGPATWLEDGSLSIELKKSPSQKTMTQMAPRWGHPNPDGDGGQEFIRPKSSVYDAEYRDLGARQTFRGNPKGFSGPELRQFFSMMDAIDEVMIIAGVAGLAWNLYEVGRWANVGLKMRKAAKKAKRLVSGKKSAKPRKAPMPGWPAINFRRGKKSKVGSSKKAAGASYTYRLDVEKDVKASFDTLDGIDEMKSIAISVSIRDRSGALVWNTSQLHIPVEDEAKLLIPPHIHAVAYASTLYAEALAYVSFIETEPDMEVSIDDNGDDDDNGAVKKHVYLF